MQKNKLQFQIIATNETATLIKIEIFMQIIVVKNFNVAY